MSRPRPFTLAAVCVLAALATRCSPGRLGMNRMADALSSTAAAYAKDDDPEFVRLSAPSTLKMMEMLIEDQPAHPGLLLGACSGFAQYAYGFLQIPAEEAETPDSGAAKELLNRAEKMYDRARQYCTRLLELRHRGISAALARDALAPLGAMTKTDVPSLYWMGVSMAGAVSVAPSPLLRVNQLAIARAVLSRALALDETWENGAIHEAFITLDGQPALLGGSTARAREHFKRAVELSGGQSAWAYVTLAESVSLREANRTEFERVLRAALAIDIDRTPGLRLANAIAQRHARFLLARADRLFKGSGSAK